jgi:hypothetical protein
MINDTHESAGRDQAAVHSASRPGRVQVQAAAILDLPKAILSVMATAVKAAER